jgi:hypothetical protein
MEVAPRLALAAEGRTEPLERDQQTLRVIGGRGQAAGFLSARDGLGKRATLRQRPG